MGGDEKTVGRADFEALQGLKSLDGGTADLPV
jgi:hypothetical protein